MARSTTDGTKPSAETIAELAARIVVLGVCGTLCFFGGAETLRALENDNLSSNDALLVIGTVVLAIVTLRSAIRTTVLLTLLFRTCFAEQITRHLSDPSIVNSVLYRPKSKLSWPLMLFLTFLVVGMIITLSQVAIIRNESAANVLQVCTALGLTMLTLPLALILWSAGQRMWGIVLGCGAVSVSVFWIFVTISVTFDQLNFENASPFALGLVGSGILCGSMLLAGAFMIGRIYTLLQRPSDARSTSEASVEK